MTMLTSVILTNYKAFSKLNPSVLKICVSTLSTQSFYQNMYNAHLLKEVESSYSEIDYDYSATHHTIMELLDCQPREAIDIIEDSPHLLRLPANDLIKIKKICKENKVPPNIIKRNLWITTMSPFELDHRFLYYWKWSFINELKRPKILKLLSLSLSTLRTFTCRAIFEKNQIPQRNRISYFSDKLQSSVEECTDLIIKHPYLMTRGISTVFQIIDMILDAGVDPKDIYRDPWLMVYNPKFIQQRILKLQEENILKIKPWMVRCKESSFNRCIEIRQLSQEVTKKFDNKETYLCKRLNADPIEVMENKKKYPRVSQVSLTKLKTMLDLLLRENYSPKEILKYIEVLTFSPDTIEWRIQEVKSRGIENCNLSTLCKRNKIFDLYLKTLDKQNAMNKTTFNNRYYNDSIRRH